MSMITEQCDKLQCQADYIRRTIPELKGTAKLIEEAIDTIKTQSEKLHAYAMERSSQYYNGGWIPCNECMPRNNEDVLITLHNGEVMMGFHHIHKCIDCWYIGDLAYGNSEIIAWRPLPTPYKREDKTL